MVRCAKLSNRGHSDGDQREPGHALDVGGTALMRARATSQARLVPDDPVDIARHLDVVLRDTTRRMRYQRESDRSPTDIDIGVMILGFGVLSHLAHSIDAGKE
jgi:hypothetical protein